MTDSTLPGLEAPLPTRHATRTRKAVSPDASKAHHVTGAGARIGGDHIALWWIEVAGTVGIALAAFAVSVTSLLQVAAWQHTPDFLHFLTPVMIDLPITVFTTMTISFKYREHWFAMWLARILSLVLTTFSSIANFLHTVDVNGGLSDYQDAVGAGFNAAAPWILYCCIELLGHLITRPKGERGKYQRQQAEIKSLKSQLRAANRASKPVES